MFRVENGKLIIELDPYNAQVLPYFPEYDVNKPAEGVIIDYGNPLNSTGHQQRSWINYWALRAFVESGGVIGLELGSAGVISPCCLNTDFISHGLQGERLNIQEKIDASKELPYADDAFSCVVSNHVLEHVECKTPFLSQRARYRQRCLGLEIVPILQEWIRVIRPGGYMACILPDDKYPRESGSSSLFHDQTHQHAWDAKEFHDRIISHLTQIELIQIDTLRNKFSFDFVLKKI